MEILPHLLQQLQISLSPLLLILFTCLTILYLHHDYHQFLSLGPGGTPSTPLGYFKIKLLSLVSLRDPLHPLPIPPHFRPQSGYLTSLPLRKGARPTVAGIAPQRQRTQTSPPHVYARLALVLRALTIDPRNALQSRTSCFEKHSVGLFAATPITRTCGGEVCHAHPSDGSMHIVLHPADAKLVLEQGWGERHPLARGGWFRRFVPREFVLVYAARGEGDVDVIVGIVRAGVWWVSGVDVAGRGRDREVQEGKGKGGEREKECWACRVHGCGGKGKVEQMVGDA
ncbi:hypothetical protein EJ04DRAFT_501731 [Polyplosphaeria fusca]|uniref:Luciferase domain-containing protein n=1 Tax=Polyplosphaeria fusca TaxID=682080 RepID=A0A9P4QLY7_9PLEO|nr:hypothetical protein EJ04DRAFT_501731 [Polyplosphaeria fusca]